MPPSGTTGKSTSKSASKSTNRGPSGGMMGGSNSGGSSRTAPSKSASSKMGKSSSQSGAKAQSTGSRIGSVASASKFSNNKTNQTASRDKGIAGVPGGLSRTGMAQAPKQKTQFERFQERYPRGLKDMNIQSINPPMPGGFGPAGNVVRGTIAGVQKFAGNLMGAGKRAAEAQKRFAELEKMRPGLERLKQSEALKRGKTSVSQKLPDKMPPMKLSQIREAAKNIPGYKTWDKIEGAIDKVTELAGYGTGTMARAKTAAVAGVPVQAAYEAGKAYRDSSGWKKGGLVKKKKR